MIRKAKLCGADCVKFQKSNLTEKFTQQALARSYNSQHSFGNTYGEHKFHLEFSEETYKDLQNFCQNEVKIAMTASAMDEKSVEFLDEVLNVPFIKIGSGDVNNHFVLEKVARLEHRNAVISTGMSNIDQVQNIYKVTHYRGMSFRFKEIEKSSKTLIMKNIIQIENSFWQLMAKNLMISFLIFELYSKILD